MGVNSNIFVGLKNIADGLITFAKIQNIATTKILGRTTAGSGVIEELGVSNALQLDTGIIYANQVLNSKSASYTLVIADESKSVVTTGASNISITIPLNSSVAFKVGTSISIITTGTGIITIVATAGVTINSKDGLVLDGQYSVASVIKIDTDTWVAIGRLKA